MHTHATNWFCATRAMKNAKYLQKVAPHIIPEIEPKDGFESIIPLKILDRLHQDHALDGMREYVHLAELLKGVTFPAIRTQAAAPLFDGTLHFVQMEFTIRDQGNKIISIGSSDMATILNYANLATMPISEYAAQYGPNGIGVNQSIIPFAVTLPSATYNDAQLQGWVNSIVSQNRLPSNAGIIVPNPPGVVNVDGALSKKIGGYHFFANVPYAFANVLAQNLTLEDSDGSYAMIVSHEIAEMAVDPRGDLANPEVCDPCSFNCDKSIAFLDFFDNCAHYISTSTSQAPPPPTFGFFINGIVRSDFATQCPPSDPNSACNYAPSLINGPFSLSSRPGVDADYVDAIYEVNLFGAPLTSIRWQGEKGVSFSNPTAYAPTISFDMSDLSYGENKKYTISVSVVTEGNCSMTEEMQVGVHKIPCHSGQDSCGGTGS